MDFPEIVPTLTPSPGTLPQGPADPARLEAAAKEFEAVFLRQFLGESMKPLLHPTPGSEAPGRQIYEYFVTDALAGELSEKGLFGFSSLLQMQLTQGPSMGESRPGPAKED